MAPWHLLPGQLGQEPPRWRYPRHVSTGTGQPATSPTISPAPPPVSEPTGPAGGDLEGSTYPAPIVAAGKITLGKLAAAVQALIESKLAKAGAVAGDLEGEAQAPAIAAGKVTLAKLAAAVVTLIESKATAAEWVNVEAVNAKLEQTVTIQAAIVGGVLFLRGLGKASAEIAAKGVLFTLPAGFRPATERQVTYSTAAASTASLEVKPTGEVATSGALTAGKTPRFDGVAFSL